MRLAMLTRLSLRHYWRTNMAVVLGVSVGLPAAVVASRWLQSMLFGLTATDPGIIATAVSVLVAAGLVAAWFPARRAARVDPMTALRHE